MSRIENNFTSRLICNAPQMAMRNHYNNEVDVYQEVIKTRVLRIIRLRLQHRVVALRKLP